MARKKSKQQGVGNKELVAGQKKPVSPGGAGGDAGLDRLKNQPMHTCCLLCHREFKDWGANSVNGLPGGHGAKLADTVGRKLADAVPSLSQSLLGEVPLWICQSCRKSVEEEERRSAQEEPSPVPLSHSSSCKSQSCGNGYPEHSSVDWDPSSFLSAHKLSGLWNSAHSNGGVHCNHNAVSHSQQGGTRGPVCHEKRGSHEAPGKSAKTSGAKVCPYSHPSSQNSSGTSPGNPHSTSDLCKTTPKHFKTVCRRPTPPGEAFHPSDHHQHSDLSVPPNSPTGLSSQHSSLLPPKQSSGTHSHIPSSPSPGLAAHAPFSPLVPNLHSPSGKLSSGPDSPTALHKPSPCKNSHIPAVNTQHSKLGGSLMGCNHPCNGNSGATVAASNVGHLTAGACRDQACKGHKLANGTLCHAPSELEDGEDEDSSSERSSCASSSTNQKDGKYCDCCYCEFFGHNAPPAAPTSRNYAEIREKLRSRLTRRKEELPQRQDSDPGVASTIDNRDVDELLDFINNSEPKPTNSAKAAKRARHKQKKKEKEKSPGCMEAGGSDPLSTPPEPADDPSPEGSEASRLLEWPQLELERVNSFLTSRLEEIKNTIKDSIRASFSMYDLNLDVNDFPKKAATLEGNHLLSHLNGSTDLQQIDLDLAPLSLGNFKSHLDLVNGLTSSTNTTTAAGAATGPKDVQRLHSTPNLSKLIRIRSPEACPSSGLDSQQQTPVPAAPNEAAKEDVLDSRNSVAAGAGAAASAAKVKKGKKQLQKQEQPLTEQNSAKHTKAASGNEFMSKGADLGSNSYKIGSRLPPPPQLLPSAESQRTVPKNPTESRLPRQATNGTATGVSNTHRSKSDTEKRGGRSEQEAEGRGHAAAPTNGQQQQQQPKGKNKKNKNKGEKSSPTIDDVFLPKDVDATEMDEIDREVEYFKRFCLDSAKQTRQKVAVNWSNFSLKKVSSNAAQ